MKRSELKGKALEFCKKYSYGKEPDIDCLYDAIEDMGYTVVEYSVGSNDEDTDKLIKALKISNALLNSGGFTYADRNVRCVFINDSLSTDEKRVVASHESGHIYLGHMTYTGHVGKTVEEEHDANIFADLIVEMPFSLKLSLFCARHKKALIISSVVIFVIAVLIAVYAIFGNNPDYMKEYYVTATGEKYHVITCKYVEGKSDVRLLTEDEYKLGIYTPCKICLPELNK